LSIAIIVGSAAINGNTEQLCANVAAQIPATIFNLNDYHIKQFDYQFNNQDDDFITLIKEILSHDKIIFASPVYWYSASGIMKTFIDRLSDLLKVNKPLGYQLKNKINALIATGCDGSPALCFEQAFELTAQYLGMNYQGMLYCCCPDEFELDLHQTKISDFIRGLNVN